MLALQLDGGVALVDRPAPERAPGEARVQMSLAGVCDTDLQLARGYMGYRGVLGHEFVGRVLECDTPLWLGRRVVADINAGCGSCEECRLRRGHHCPRRTVLGILGRDGALAEELVIPERCLVAVPDGVSDEAAVFAEPLAAALHVRDAIDARANGPTIVLGDGKLGLLIALALRHGGVEVLLVGHHDEKLALARAAGIRTLLEADLAADASAPMVVEATGSERGVERALGLAEPRGTVVLKTTVADRTSVDLSPIVIKELRLVGSRCGDLASAIAALADGSVDPTPLVSARYPLSEAAQALQHAGRRGTLKVLVEGMPQRSGKQSSSGSPSF